MFNLNKESLWLAACQPHTDPDAVVCASVSVQIMQDKIKKQEKPNPVIVVEQILLCNYSIVT